MNPLSSLLVTLLFGPFAVYLTGRLFQRAKGERPAGTAAGLAAIVLAVVAFAFLFMIRIRLGAGQTVALDGAAPSPLAVSLRADSLSTFMAGITLIMGLIAMVFSLGYMREDTGVDKFYAVFLLMLGAMVGLVMANDLFNLFVFFEMMSIASFVLVSFRKSSWEPIEAGFKYIILSCVGSFLLLLGMLLMFMYTGELNLARIAAGLADVPREPKLIMISFIVAGLGVKAAIVPLHTWLPDAHSAAPSGVSAFLSGVVIQTGLFAMIRVLIVGFGNAHAVAGLVFLVFGALTMTIGNLTALQQTDIKRMLAYSSVAQMGYIMLGLGVGWRYGVIAGLDGGVFHVMTHAFMKGLAFMCAGALIHAAGTREINELHGLGRKMPVTAVLFTLSVLGLAGVPPFSGFMSKLLIYEAGFKTGIAAGYALACLAILNSVISLGYYLPAVTNLFAPRVERKPGRIEEAPLSMLVSMFVLAALTLVLGIWPEIGLRAVYPAVRIITKPIL